MGQCLSYINKETPMHTIAHYLHQEHVRCDGEYNLAEAQVSCGDWDGARRHFDAFLVLFETHLSKEEQVLFPRMERAVGNAYGPTLVMRSEHGHMREILARMQEAIAEHEAGDFFDQADAMRILMHQHNLKEEGILYPQADRLLHEQINVVLSAMDELVPETSGSAA
jgi:iron-sulfur cluster repair protein YtfE (RIC family)